MMHKFWAIAVGCALSVGIGVAQEVDGIARLSEDSSILTGERASSTGSSGADGSLRQELGGLTLNLGKNLTLGGGISSEKFRGAGNELLVESLKIFNTDLPSNGEVIVVRSKLFEPEMKEWRQLDTVLDVVDIKSPSEGGEYKTLFEKDERPRWGEKDRAAQTNDVSTP